MQPKKTDISPVIHPIIQVLTPHFSRGNLVLTFISFVAF